MILRKTIYLILALVCLILGIIGLILPIMPGLIFIVIAIVFLSKTSTLFNKFFRKLRVKYKWLDKMWGKIEKN